MIEIKITIEEDVTHNSFDSINEALNYLDDLKEELDRED